MTTVTQHGWRKRYPVFTIGAVALSVMPSILMAISAIDSLGAPRALAAGVSVTLLLEAVFLVWRYGPRSACSPVFLIAFNGIAFGILRFYEPDWESPVFHFCAGICLIIPAIAMVASELVAHTGDAREAKLLLRKLLLREDWPDNYQDYRSLPDVLALHRVLRRNPSPAIPLLGHQDVRVQVAILTALESVPVWGRGQPELILQLASHSDESAVRIAAVLALTHVKKTRHLWGILNFLHDSAADVRRATAVAVLWDSMNRWPEICTPIRDALADPRAIKDGPLPCSDKLPMSAVEDLITWAAEAGPLGKRATQTLLRHTKKAINEDGSPEIIARITSYVGNLRIPPGIRVEIAHQLQKACEFPPEAAARFLGQDQPTMLRLLAAGSLLAQREDPRAIQILREAGKNPNRQIALASADLIQRFLGVDLGLPVGGPLPDPKSREAAEVSRRVLNWVSNPTSLTVPNPAGEAFDQHLASAPTRI